MPWDDLTSRSDLYIPLPRIGFVSLAVTQHPDGQWKAWSGSGFLPGDFPTREAAKLAAEAEARRVLMQGLRELSPDHLGRTDQDFAIEFGEYLAKAAERFMDHHNSREYPSAAELDEGVDRWRALQAAIHEFRKRAERAALTAAMGGE